MPVDVFVWLASRERQAAEAAQRATAAGEEGGWLAGTLTELAAVQVRLARAVQVTLNAHQPALDDERCLEDGQRWPCRTQKLTAAALNPPPQSNH